MAIFYKMQTELDRLSQSTGKTLSTHRLSDLKQVKYKGRGGRLEEINSLRSSGDLDGENNTMRYGDAWMATPISDDNSKRWSESKTIYLLINGFQ